VAELLAQAPAVLKEGGLSPSQTTLDRIEATLHAAVKDEAGRELLEGGRLTFDLDPSGFGLPEAFGMTVIYRCPNVGLKSRLRQSRSEASR